MMRLRVVVRQRVLVRAVLGHAVAALRPDALLDQARDHLARHRRAGNAKAGEAAEALQVAPLHLAEQIDGVRGHADEKAGVGFQDAVGEACAARQIVNDSSPPIASAITCAPKPRLWRERRQRVDDRLVVDRPVLRELAGVGQQRVVGVHHALGLAGRARGEGEIDHLVGVALHRLAGAFGLGGFRRTASGASSVGGASR